jgi:F-type H+-transporting ATPase subunit gamma
MDTLENLRRKTEGAKNIKSVVKTMKAVAAANIGQYELALSSLGEYYYTIALGMVAYFHSQEIVSIPEKKIFAKNKEKNICAIVFGSDQGLVGSFNDTLTDFTATSLHAMQGKKEIWATGGRIQLLLEDAGFDVAQKYTVPASVHAITQLVGQVLVQSQQDAEKEPLKEFYIFHNQPKPGSGYEAVSQRLLPMDETWWQGFKNIHWPTPQLPQVAGGIKPTLAALIREYLFVSLFKSCAESLDSENASRLAAMQRAEKNIEEMLDSLNSAYNLTRQSAIDEELFDVVSGFEALKSNARHGK